jgi:hypothetical protein
MIRDAENVPLQPDVLEHLPVARLEDMERQKFVRQQNERQGKQGKMPDSQNFI